MKRGNEQSEPMTRRSVLQALGALAIGGKAVLPTDADANEDVLYEPETDPTTLTDKNRGQLISEIPGSAKGRIASADLVAPLNALESQQNTDKPTANENGLVTLTAIREQGDIVDLQYEFTVNDADDLAQLTQGHVHHAPRGTSDNRLFFALFARSDLDGSDGTPADPPLSVSRTLSEQLARYREQSKTLDNGFSQNDPDVPAPDEDFVPNLARNMLAEPREYQINAHTVEFQSEAIRGQLRPATFGKFDQSDLVEVVLATRGPDALTASSGGPPSRGGRGRGRGRGR